MTAAGLVSVIVATVLSGSVATGSEGVVIENCGVSITYAQPPARTVTLNQAATEVMLALGLQDRLVGTAYLDDAILPELAAAYKQIPVLAAIYPSREVLLAARPDFLYAAVSQERSSRWWGQMAAASRACCAVSTVCFVPTAT